MESLVFPANTRGTCHRVRSTWKGSTPSSTRNACPIFNPPIPIVVKDNSTGITPGAGIESSFDLLFISTTHY